MLKSKGFTLLELIIVITIIGIISVSAFSRFTPEQTFAVKIEQENLISALNQAQQLAMSGQNVSFTITNGSPDEYSVNIGGSPVILGSLEFPAKVELGISLSPAPLTLNYSGLGATSATTITVSSGSDSLSVIVEPSGYAH